MRFLRFVGSFFDPVPDPQTAPYLRSFLVMRLGIGALGFTLPLILVFGNRWAFGEAPMFRGSLSAYYYSGFREIFIGFIGTMGGFLLMYKIVERSLENTMSILAGASAMLIPFFPTNQPGYVKNLDADHKIPLTLLQRSWGEKTVAHIHYGASIAFLIFLTIIVAWFSVHEFRDDRSGKVVSKRIWGSIHLASALVMTGTLIWLGLAHIEKWGPDNALLIGEWICAWSFSISWILKGAEWDMLLHPSTAGSDRSAHA
jgi:hypothetical protein